MAERFGNFVAIDWSGAVGERHAGIAVALCSEGDAAPRLVRAGQRWSRAEALHWLVEDLPADSLVGLDLGLSLPFADRGAYFPGWADSPDDARSLWALVEAICVADPHLAVGSFVDHPQAARHFRRHGGREGDLFGADGQSGDRGRLRVTERRQAELGCQPYSNFNLVGAAQVGKASLTGMRLLHALAGRLPIWPVDPLPGSGSVIVEIYTAIAALAAGRRAGASKIRTRAELDSALAALGSQPSRQRFTIDDHKTDALLAAAWLRANADRPELWHPASLTAQLACTEGWTFGAP